VEQIAGNKQKINIHLPGLCDNLGKGILDCLGPLPAPRFITVRGHAPVDIGSVDEFHVSSSLKIFKSLAYGLPGFLYS
jgi:hypothetical protein